MSERTKSGWRRRAGMTLVGLSGVAALGGGVTLAIQAESSKPTATPIERPQRNALNQAAKDAAMRALDRYLEAKNDPSCQTDIKCYADAADNTLQYRQDMTQRVPLGETMAYSSQTIKSVLTNSGVELDIDFVGGGGFTETPGVYTPSTIKSASLTEEGLVLANSHAEMLTSPLTPDAIKAFLIDPDTHVERIKTNPTDTATAIVGPEGIDMQYGNVYYGEKPEGAAVAPFVMKQIASIGQMR